MKHLLLISNISIKNKRLLEYAADFCKHYECKLHVLHINNYSEPVLVSSPYYYDQNNLDYIKNLDEQSAINVASKISNILDKEMVQIQIAKGNQEKILTSFINNNFIDLIIIGNSDIHSDNHIMNQKNLLLNVVDTPLLVIPDLLVFNPLLTFNFLTTHSENDIDDIIHLSKTFPKSKIKVSHFNVSNTEVRTKEKNWEKYVSTKVHEQIEFINLKEEVTTYVKSENYSLLRNYDAFVFTAQKRKFWSRLLNPSTTLRFLAGLEVPCVIYKVN